MTAWLDWLVVLVLPACWPSVPRTICLPCITETQLRWKIIFILSHTQSVRCDNVRKKATLKLIIAVEISIKIESNGLKSKTGLYHLPCYFYPMTNRRFYKQVKGWELGYLELFFCYLIIIGYQHQHSILLSLIRLIDTE